ncbi:MAG: hypothetical protein IKI58_03245 [Oscillospiraceae bacterium]|nr:hypothetical protein [Oscillospiraceae bacterium]
MRHISSVYYAAPAAYYAYAQKGAVFSMKQIETEEPDIKIYTPFRHRQENPAGPGISEPESDERLSVWVPAQKTTGTGHAPLIK